MKPSALFLPAVILPWVAMASWFIRVLPSVPGLAATTIVCGASAVTGVWAPCFITAIVSVLRVSLSSANSGGRGPTPTPEDLVRRDVNSIAHYLPNGTIHNFLNTAALEVGGWHTIQLDDLSLRASKHLQGYNIVEAPLNGGDLSKRDQDPNGVESMISTFEDVKWPVPNQWSDDELNSMANDVANAFNYDAETMCSTVYDDTDADTLDIGWAFATQNHDYDGGPGDPCPA